MKKSLRIKSIILNDKELMVNQLFDKEEGIKFYLASSSRISFNILLRIGTTIPLEKIKVRTLKNKIYTLFNCFYSIRNNNDNLYMHLKFNEIVKENVDIRNFKCNKLIVEFELTDNIKKKEFREDINFALNGITIKHLIDQSRYEVIISSVKTSNTEELFSYFVDYFELISLIIGYFPTIIKKTYMLGTKKYIVENNIVAKYISSDEFKKSDVEFLKKLNNSTFENAYIKYRKFSKKALLQLSMYFMSVMKRPSYIEIDVVNILQTLDGLYDKLSVFKNVKEDYSIEMNDEIGKLIDTIDFSNINKKYGKEININKKIIECIKRMNKVSYRKKLKNMFKYNNYIVFKEEIKKNNTPYIKYDTLITKCINSRNKFSHIDENENCLLDNENVAYIHKFILIFRLLILEEIGLKSKIDHEKLDFHLNAINTYIKRLLSEEKNN